MIVDLYEAVDRMLWALLAWIVAAAFVCTLLLLGMAAGIAWLWGKARRPAGAGEPLDGPLAPEQPESVPRDPEAVQRPSEALWALDPHDTGETPKPPVPV